MDLRWTHAFESAVAIAELATQLTADDLPHAEVLCGLHARSARSALIAASLQAGTAFAPGGRGSLVDLLRTSRSSEPDDNDDHATTQAALLALAHALNDVGSVLGYLPTAVVDALDADICAKASRALLDSVTQRLFGYTLEDLVIRHAGLRHRAWFDPACWGELLQTPRRPS